MSRRGVRKGLSPACRLLLLLAVAAPCRLAAAATYRVDTARSHVRIHLGKAGLIRFLGHEHHIEAPISEGRVEVPGEDPARASLRLRFESARLAVVPGSEPAGDVPSVEQRMRGPDVLDVARFPEITFVSTAVRRAGGDGRLRLVVAGVLSLRGSDHAVEIPLEVARDAGGIVVTGVAQLELRALGVGPPAVAGVVKVANGFELEFEIRAVPGGE